MFAFRSSLFQAVLAASLLVCAAPERAQSETREEFQISPIWGGGAYFKDDGSFGNCYLHAAFPEGWNTEFYLYPDHWLELEIQEPEGFNIDFEPKVSVVIDDRLFAAPKVSFDEEAYYMDDWLIIYADIALIQDVGPALRYGNRLTVILDGYGMDNQPRTWTYSAALSGSDQAFAALESCLAR
ncbi:MAG: hypothetical protein O3A96_02615 [Proteobacteria bacterium]|nr:hypothetical protein [Pseudomonadota bacterium]